MNSLTRYGVGKVTLDKAKLFYRVLLQNMWVVL